MAQGFSPKQQVERCRRLARAVNDPLTRERLENLAREYEAQAVAQGADAQAAEEAGTGRRVAAAES